MNTQQPSRPVITPAMREQASKQPNTWLYVVDPIFSDPNAEVPPWGFIGGYRVDERGGITDDFSPNPNYRPSPVALRLPAPTNDVERALQLTTTGYAQASTLLSALLEAELILFAQPQGSGLFTMDHESGRRQLQLFTSDGYLPGNWTSWQRMTGRQLVERNPTGMDLQINPTSPVKARIPAEDLIKTAGGHTTGAAAQAAPEAAQPAKVAAKQQPPDPLSNDFGQRFLGSMLAAAVGDALGSAVEFQPVQQIRSRFGEPGVTDYDRGGEHPGEFTDDTQMALFTLEGVIRGHVAERGGATGNPLAAIQLAYQRWLHTQGYTWSRAAGPYAERHPEPSGWLIGVRDLFAVRSPNSDCITALREFASVGAPGTFERAINDSDANTGVVRAAPIALWSDDPREVFRLAAASAALTCSKPSGHLPAGVLAVVVHRLLRGESLPDALARARALLGECAGHQQTERLLLVAEDLAAEGTPSPEQIKDLLGDGWTGHEALAIAVCAALSNDGIGPAVMAAVNHSGDSDSTAAICGAIVGARHGVSAVPGVWLRDLKQRDTVEALVTDALVEFGPQPREDEAWKQRYPAERDLVDLDFASTPPAARSAEQGAASADSAAKTSDSTSGTDAEDSARPAQARSGSGDGSQEAAAAEPADGAGAKSNGAAAGISSKTVAADSPVARLFTSSAAERGSSATNGSSATAEPSSTEDSSGAGAAPAAAEQDSEAHAESDGGKDESDGSKAEPDHGKEGKAAATGTRKALPTMGSWPTGTSKPAASQEQDSAQQSEPHSSQLTAAKEETRTPARIAESTRAAAEEPTTERGARILGCLLGGAVGDALGYPVEDESIEVIRQKYGAAGVTDLVPGSCQAGAISDETQLTLFTTEGLIRAGIRRRLYGDTNPAAPVQHAYQRWLHTQGFDWENAGGPIASSPADGWLIRETGLFAQRAPDTTCVQALHGHAGGAPMGTLLTHRLNDAKGCGGVLRAAPAGFWSSDATETFRVGAATAALTHGHPSAFLPAGALSLIVGQLLGGRSLPEAVDRALTELSTWEGHEETTGALRRAIELATEGTPTPEQIQHRLGEGRAGEQALAIAVCAALARPSSFTDAVVLAVNHSGDSDATGSICGNIMGAAHSASSVPRSWRRKLELGEVVEQLARDAIEEFGPNPPAVPEWLHRYPAGNATGKPTARRKAPAAAAQEAPADEPAEAQTAREDRAASSGEAEPPVETRPDAEEDAETTETPAAEQSAEAEQSGTPAEPQETAGAGNDSDGGLSEEELRLLAAWRKFRDGSEDTPNDLSEGLHKLLQEAFGAERAAQLVAVGDGALAEETPAPLENSERLTGCVLGSAAGDALAAPWTFTPLKQILRRHPDGVRELTEQHGAHGTATALGQQSVFVLDGLLRANVHKRLTGSGAAAGWVRGTLQHWVVTQGAGVEPALRPAALTENATLRAQRFPDEATLTALARWDGQQDLPTPSTPPNQSTGAAAAVRGPVLGLQADSPSAAVELGIAVGVLTHGHPDGYLPVAAAAATVAALRDGQTLADGVQTALTELKALEGNENTVQALRDALELAEHGPVPVQALESLGTGWHGPSALAIAVAAALAHPESFTDALALASTHSGNSAATAALCGGLLGAARGPEAVPQEWREQLELHGLLDELLRDAQRIEAEIVEGDPVPEWAQRYTG